MGIYYKGEINKYYVQRTHSCMNIYRLRFDLYMSHKKCYKTLLSLCLLQATVRGSNRLCYA